MWPGTTPPIVSRRRRKRKGKRKGVSGSERLLRSIAIKAGIAPKPRSKYRDVVPRCPSHVDFAASGFASLADLIMFVDALSRRGHKPLNAVRLPREKNPPGVLKIVAVRCPKCRGKVGVACDACASWQWGFRFFLSRREPKPVTP